MREKKKKKRNMKKKKRGINESRESTKERGDVGRDGIKDKKKTEDEAVCIMMQVAIQERKHNGAGRGEDEYNENVKEAEKKR